MTTIVAIYTGQGLSERIQPIFREELPGCRLVTIIDDSLIADVIGAGKVTPDVTRRLVQYYRHAEEIGADVILNTCSSVGEVADWAMPMFRTPIIKIDEAMAQLATKRFDRIGVLATLPTTLEPTRRLLQKEAEQQERKVEVLDALAVGAYQALVAGHPEEHDRLILEAAKSIAVRADVLVLAQGSMVRMEEALKQATGLPVYSSPRLGVLAVKAALEQLGK
ncbi:aspartate/glutamate racemase family protein [Paenibacillus radicis (ex Xue et al. 2023)]|uniref:Aspartate/glutamate racemase family protein n=1 Tax=Paenibacillus radicis (ex Xue et al. 2023) TaxID=2972489 RepID=A0ABT1YDJ4_9BACL|nr:aspartate/glutamate racemase family protein [Paenibacillus radicis (ex Xue et al. 2023)]MCR8631278.1 aspartate/glutamate racemase family protein [Paenibacillus radicis (ex Xue et al. 2023)]